ncbi:MAG: aspartate dehydrogenase domain-containing protein [Actinomycetota bacterium]
MDEALKVSILGWGAIGRTVGLALAHGRVDGAALHTVSALDSADDCPAPLVAADRLAVGADVVVEAAGQQALAAHGPAILRSGVRLLVVSAGALVDPELFAALQAAGGHRLLVTTGAIGGLDLLAAARRAGAITELTLTTSKPPAVLIQEWMDEALTNRLRRGEETVVAFDGPAADAVRRFPQSVNVAATLALAVGDWDLVRVRVVGDPTLAANRHEISIAGDAGRYHFSIENRPSPDNPKTSGIVPHAVLRALADLAATGFRLH